MVVTSLEQEHLPGPAVAPDSTAEPGTTLGHVDATVVNPSLNKDQEGDIGSRLEAGPKMSHVGAVFIHTRELYYEPPMNYQHLC
jgi:hypothetical protein